MAVAFGMDPEAAMIYLADHVGPTRLPTNDTSKISMIAKLSAGEV